MERVTADQDWESAPPRRRRVLPVVALVAVALVAGVALGGTTKPDDLAPTGELRVTEVPAPPAAEPARPVASQINGRWKNMAAGPLAGRVGAAVAWTGREVMFWSGVGAEGYADGALYNPLRNAWRPIRRGPLSARFGAAAVWDGDEVVVAGGVAVTPAGDARQPLRRLRDAAAYDPETDSWRRLPKLPFPITAGRLFARQGTLYAARPTASDRPLATLDAGASMWRMLPPVDWADAGDEAAAARHGDTLLLWPQGRGDMVTFDLMKRRWSTVPHDPAGVLDACSCTLVAGTNTNGAVDIVAYDEDTSRWWRRQMGPNPPSFAGGTDNHLFLVYNPYPTQALGRRTGTVRSLPSEPQRLGFQPTAIWTGSRLVMWGGVTGLKMRFNADGMMFRLGGAPMTRVSAR